jgi:UDP-N-acetylglucosamine:LPS N-acetylglucosamine transferase
LKKIVIIYIDGGGGHRAAARALHEVIRRQERPWQVELVNADDILELADPAFWLLGVRSNDIYNWLLRRDWMIATRQLLPIVHCMIRILHPAQVFLLKRCWRKRKPDLVLSVTPNLNRAFYQSLESENLGIPFVTALTDLADYPPHFWIEPQQQHFICGTSAAVEQAKRISPFATGIWPVSGMIVHPKFYEPNVFDRREDRRKLGLDPDLPTGLVLYGGYGSATMLQVAECMKRFTTPFQLIFLCGRNASLLRRIQSLRLPYPAYAQGFTENVAHFMALSDFLIGKPGPGSVSEALAMGLPVIVNNTWRTMVHERFNARWIEQQGFGLSVSRIRDLPPAIERLLVPATYSAVRRRIEELRNRAVFEVPEILEQILNGRYGSLTAQRDEWRAAKDPCTG